LARIEFAPRVVDDFERILAHLIEHHAGGASAERIAEILQAIDVLAPHPLMGRPAQGGRRELVIGHRERGYVALYRYVEEVDTVFVLAIRAQREAGYAEDGE
jgi:plasmid stabilization system protein ParE